MTREQIKQQMSIEEALQVLSDTNCYGTMDIAKAVIIDYVKEQEGKKENYPEYLKACARLLKTFCEFQSDQSRRCLECYFWNDTEGCSIYDWPEYWEV